MRMRVGNIEKCTTSQSAVSPIHILSRDFLKTLQSLVNLIEEDCIQCKRSTVVNLFQVLNVSTFSIVQQSDSSTILQFYDSTILTPSDPTLYSTAVFIAHLAKLI